MIEKAQAQNYLLDSVTVLIGVMELRQPIFRLLSSGVLLTLIYRARPSSED